MISVSDLPDGIISEDELKKRGIRIHPWFPARRVNDYVVSNGIVTVEVDGINFFWSAPGNTWGFVK